MLLKLDRPVELVYQESEPWSGLVHITFKRTSVNQPGKHRTINNASLNLVLQIEPLTFNPKKKTIVAQHQDPNPNTIQEIL